MKILSLKIRNIQSLKGEHMIDFSTPPLNKAGLILLTGEIGAGKTTILDAITLALFGRTNRHGKDKSDSLAQHVISYNTTEGYASVVFQVNNQKYQAEWIAKKSKNENKFKVENHFFDLQDASRNKVSKTSEALEAVQKVLKLDFEQFTRSVMLAQGEFSRFLKSNPNEKAQILEKLTDTTIYKKISQKVYEKYKEETDKLKQLHENQKAIKLLSDEEKEALHQQKQSIEKQNVELQKQLKEIQKTITKFTLLQELEEQFEKHEIQYQKLIQKNSEIKFLQEAYNWHKKTQHLHQYYFSWQENQQQINKLQEEINAIYQELEKLTSSLLEQKEKLQSKETEKQQFETSYKELQNIIPTQISLQTRIESLKQQLYKKRQEQQKVAEKLHQWQVSGSLQENLSKIQEVDNQIKRIEDILNTLPNYEQIIQEITEKQDLQMLIKELQEKRKQHEENTKVLLESQEYLQKLQQEKQKIEQDIERLNQTYAELQTQKQEEETKKSLEEYRKFLVPGKPCPLCGSLHHPFASSSTPAQLSEIEVKIKQVEKECKTLEEKRSDLPISYLQEKINDLANKQASLNKNIQQIESTIGTYSNNPAEATKKIEEDIKQLQNKLKESNNYRDRLINLKKQYAALQEEKILLELQSEIAEIEKELQESQDEYKKNRASCEKILPTSLISTLDKPELLSKLLQRHQEKLTKEFEELKNHYQNINLEVERKKSYQQILQSQLDHKKQVKDQLTRFLQEELPKIELRQIEELPNKILAQTTFREYEEKIQKYNQALQDIETYKNKIQQEIWQIQQTLPTNETLPNLKQKELLKQNQLNENHKQLGIIEEKLHTEKQNYHRFKEQQKRIEEQEKITQNWQLLNELIGSKEGDKFARFAQSITIERLIKRANLHLSNLTERYYIDKIQLDKKDFLDLCIVDRFQADNKREISTLSGGETFLISLSLALGLADMANQNVKIDMLFIDEGFGTLDTETLDTAISVLENLQNTGKTIVIISHLVEIKERIHTQIGVEKIGKGISRIVIS